MILVLVFDTFMDLQRTLSMQLNLGYSVAKLRQGKHGKHKSTSKYQQHYHVISNTLAHYQGSDLVNQPSHRKFKGVIDYNVYTSTHLSKCKYQLQRRSEKMWKQKTIAGQCQLSMMDSVTWKQKKKNPPNQIVGEEKLANHVLDFLESAI